VIFSYYCQPLDIPFSSWLSSCYHFYDADVTREFTRKPCQEIAINSHSQFLLLPFDVKIL